MGIGGLGSSGTAVQSTDGSPPSVPSLLVPPDGASSPGSATPAPQNAPNAHGTSNATNGAQPAAKGDTQPAQSVAGVGELKASFKYLPGGGGLVVVFTNPANGQQVAQVPAEALIKLMQLDQKAGELVDRNV